ncbi:MAG: hypothetical protein JNM66_04650 [Bryobacterales bacterium]|nr:hypothetical protein [Bryobacterales bacterium]
MRLCFSRSSIEFRRWASRSEMEGYLAAFDCQLVIGESAESEQEFFSATIRPVLCEATKQRLAVGVCSSGHGIEPQILPLPGRGLLLFGLNEEVIAIRADTGGVAYRIPLEFLFHFMVHLADIGLVLVFHEIGVTALRENGETPWTFGRDVLEEAWLEEGTLHLTFMDSEPVAIELASGRELK